MSTKNPVTAGHHDLTEIDFTTLFASSIHDIKNLLFMLLNSLDETISTVSTNDDDAKITSSKLSLLKYNGQRINDKLIQMLALFSIAQERYQINIAYHSVEDFIEDMVIEAKPLLNARSITITGVVEDGLCWFFDKEIVAGIISNAIHNALNYAKSEIRINAYAKNEYLVIDVEDDGEGFPQHILQNGGTLSAINEANGKTGLGLYFASVSANLHINKKKSGQIELHNGGKLNGAVFTLSLP